MNTTAATRPGARRSAMITLRLYRHSDPSRQIDERRLEDGELLIGRGGEAGWSLEDPSRLLSRRHCSISLVEGSVTLTDLSANGVFVGEGQERAPPRRAVTLAPGETLRLGDYVIVLDAADPARAPSRQADAPFLLPTAASDAPAALAASDWEGETRMMPMRTSGARPDDNGALLEAFCAGAHLDVSAFADDDPAEIMERLGAVYKQMVIGLTEVMSERTAVKAEYLLEHTTVRPTGNNPFRWANPQRIAVDLLREGRDGFLSGPAAVKASFGDVRKHLQCIFAGLRSALEATLQALSPKAIEARSRRGGLFKDRAAEAWREYVGAHRQCQQDAGEDPDGLVNREFRAGYARRLQELDGEPG